MHGTPRARAEGLFDLAPAALVRDLHPSYLSGQWAREQARNVICRSSRCSTIMRISRA